MRVNRGHVEQAFGAFAEGGSGVVIGAPGSGKTYLLERFVDERQRDPSAYCFFVPVDRLPEVSDTSLAQELRIDRDLFDVLEEEASAEGIARAYFVVDALDAARSDRGRTEVVQLLRRARGRLSEQWSVIVSVRTYDARRSEDLEELFGAPSQDVPPDFRLDGVVCRHFYVPPLTDAEILSTADEIPGLADIWDAANPELKSILRTPFALWLFERIVASGGEDEISRLRSEIDLLALFWRLRVDAGGRGVEKRAILERVAEGMLATRTLSVQTTDAYQATEQAAWEELHSSEILTSSTVGPSRTSFGHNILFDYAVSILSLAATEDAFRRFLEDDPSRALFLRPSLNYFFLRLWHHDRTRFWSILFSVGPSQQAQARLFTRVLPPTIVANEARRPEDLEPLVERLAGHDDSAPEITSRVLQALRFAGVPRADVWAPVCVRFSHLPETAFVWDLALVLDRINQIAAEGSDARLNVGEAVRALLAWAYDVRAENPIADRLGSVWLVPLVAQTLETNEAASSDLLRRVVEGIGDDAVSVDYAYRLADQLDKVWLVAPGLAALFFQRAFSYVELSEERTHMGGIVVALSSTRRQDFDMVQWNLKRHAPAFLRDVPNDAVPALIQSINACVQVHELGHREQAPPSFSFDFRGIRATYTRDGSHFWDASGTVRDDAQELMDALVDYLESLADSDTVRLGDAISRVGQHASMAFVWRRLLAMAARRPEAFAHELFDLLLAEPVLSCLETVREAAEFLAAAMPHLSDDALLRVEQLAVRLAGQDDDVADSPIGRIIQRIPDDRLQTDEGVQLKELTSANVRAQANPPLVEFHMSSGPFTEDMWLSEQGVDVEDPAVQRLTGLANPIGVFEDNYRNTPPTPESIREVAAQMQAVLAELPMVEVPEAVDDSVWAKLGGAAALLAHHGEMLEPDEVQLTRRVLLEAATGRAPDPANAGEFTFPAWSPAARNEAAEGLPHLKPTREDADVIAAIRALARDPVPSVRWLLAVNLWAICDSAPEAFWEVAREYLGSEVNAAVLDAVARSLGVVATSERQTDVEESLQLLLDREDFEVGGQQRLKPDDNLANLIAGLALGRGSEWALGVIYGALDGLPERGAEVGSYTWVALDFVHVDRVDIPDFSASIARAITWLIAAVEAAATALAVTDRSTLTPDQLRPTFEIVDQVVSRVFFHSGVYKDDKRPPVPFEATCQFFALTRDLVVTVAEQFGGEGGLGLPASTAHHLVEYLHGVVRCDPVAVTHLARLAVEGGVSSGYAFDSIAAREVTELVEELLSDHRELLRDGEPLADLMFLLDTFVAAGWSDAQHLVFRLEEIFR
jgi:hypothetical protein